MARKSGWSMSRWVVVGCVVLVGAGVVYGVALYARPSVVVTEVVEGPAVEAFYATGTLEPAREYPIRATAAGIVRKPPGDRQYVDQGDAVEAGEPLAVIADAQWQAAYDRAKAELEETRQRAAQAGSPVLREFAERIAITGEQLDIARREQDRIVRLLEKSGSSPSEFDQALTRVKNLSMELSAATAQLDQMKLTLAKDMTIAQAGVAAADWNLQQQTLSSPVAGVVLDRPAPPGTRLGVNDLVMRIADVRPEMLVMRAQVDEEDITKVKAEQTVRMVLYAFAGEPFEGKVTRIYPKADPERRTFEVDITPTKPDLKFKAGMTGELAFEVRKEPSTIIVPSQAVQDGLLWRIDAGTLQPIKADVGIKGVERAQILSGLRPGDRILISPAAGLRAGKLVRQTYLDPASAAALNKPRGPDIFRGGF